MSGFQLIYDPARGSLSSILHVYPNPKKKRKQHYRVTPNIPSPNPSHQTTRGGLGTVYYYEHGESDETEL